MFSNLTVRFIALLTVILSTAFLPGLAIGQTAIASSELLPAANAVDGDVETFWSSNASATEDAVEMIYLDQGVGKVVNQMILTPRFVGQALAFPKDFKLIYSDDASAWIDVPDHLYTDYDRPSGNSGEVFIFSDTIRTRYIGVMATKLDTDNVGTYYFQLAEIAIDSIQTTPEPGVVASSEVLPAANAFDGDINTFWASAGYIDSLHTEWIYIDQGEAKDINRLIMTPRFVGQSFCFPKDFSISYSDDAVTWTAISGQNYDDYPMPTSASGEVFNFDEVINARFFKVEATELTKDDGVTFYFQLAEIDVEYVAANVPAAYASSVVAAGWEANNIIDGNLGSCWSSVGGVEGNREEWIYIDQTEVKTVAELVVTPRFYGAGTLCFPVDFKFQTSDDAVTWIDVPGQSHTNFATKGNNESEVFTFDSPVDAQYVKFLATKLSDEAGTYYCQIAEIELKEIGTPKKAAIASSFAGEGMEADKAIDGNVETFWSSQAQVTIGTGLNFKINRET